MENNYNKNHKLVEQVIQRVNVLTTEFRSEVDSDIKLILNRIMEYFRQLILINKDNMVIREAIIMVMHRMVISLDEMVIPHIIHVCQNMLVGYTPEVFLSVTKLLNMVAQQLKHKASNLFHSLFTFIYDIVKTIQIPLQNLSDLDKQVPDIYTHIYIYIYI